MSRARRSEIADTIRRNPDPGFGFIYILSHPDMPGLYKIGLTTNSVWNRISELSSVTGLARWFWAERLFPVEAHKLAEIEKSVHDRLKQNGFHHGKEFFNANLQVCVCAVEDAIYQLTRTRSPDLIGQAADRAVKAKKRAAEEKLSREQEEARQALVSQAMECVDERRRAHLQASGFRGSWRPKVWAFTLAASGISTLIVPLGWLLAVVLCFLVAGWEARVRADKIGEAEALFPYPTKSQLEVIGGRGGTRSAESASLSPNESRAGFAGLPTKGMDVRLRIKIEKQMAYEGGLGVVTMPSGRKIQVSIPARTRGGQRLRLRGMGHPGPNGGAAGDAIILVKVSESVQKTTPAERSSRPKSPDAVNRSKPLFHHTKLEGLFCEPCDRHFVQTVVRGETVARCPDCSSAILLS